MPEGGGINEPFHRIERQHEADRLGMLVFLGSEVMLFGGLFTAAMALRLTHPGDYQAAAAHLNVGLGTANTAILLTSSFLAALATEQARAGRPRLVAWVLAGTVLLGLLFLGIKAVEYAGEYREGLMPGLPNAHFEGRVQQLFMNLYFVSAGLHAIHVTVGLILLTVAASLRRARQDRGAVLIGNAALYWHLVDIVWIFLYPTLYLAGIK